MKVHHCARSLIGSALLTALAAVGQVASVPYTISTFALRRSRSLFST